MIWWGDALDVELFHWNLISIKIKILVMDLVHNLDSVQKKTLRR